MMSELPKRISRLAELAGNLWWSWHHNARELFCSLDNPLWQLTGQNPVKQLNDIDPFKLQAAAKDPVFLSLYDAVMASFDADVSVRDTWYATNYPELLHGPIAYFSAEFALHGSLPIYAGGLGILAGDTCKEACDLGLPFVGLGFMYPQGYFRQHISADGWQEETYQQLDFHDAPIHPIPWPDGQSPLLSISLAGRTVYFSAWQVLLGRIKLYLIDTNLDENTPRDRLLSARLYTADREHRLQQEILLGIGGVRLLRALGISPSVWHANEGHTAFMVLERAREGVVRGASFTEAAGRIRANTVFTTHTPVPAGHDVFSSPLMDKYFGDYWGSLGLNRDAFLALGRADISGADNFNMTALALKMSGHRSGVSRLHGEVTRRMWHNLWPEVKEDKVPISHVTNGVHVPTWLAPELHRLLERYMGQDLLRRHDDPEAGKVIDKIPDEDFWAVRQNLKRKLVHIIDRRAQGLWASPGVTAEQVVAAGSLFDSNALTIGFVRRFAEYKRPALVFYDVERLKRILTDQGRPVQIIFGSKSHPSDLASKHLLQQVYNLSKDREFQGRIAFIEDYDMRCARYLVQGVDLWLNNPRRLQEGSGTSGMEAAVNGIPHLSVLDGWWLEGFNGKNGWAIGEKEVRPEAEDSADAASLYQLLEEEIVPLFYDRDRQGVPHGWIKVAKNAVRSVMPAFSARRMLKEYASTMYSPAAQGQRDLDWQD
ncbi:MAG: alpha-glucan family phosphorylase [Chloroflexota bacterium]